jgi:peptide subunit release factor 1 (eRF1)
VEADVLTDRDLRELIEYRPGHPVLSVYLNVDPSQGTADAHRLRLRQLLKGLNGDSPRDYEVLERFLEHEFDWSGKSVALFSCSARRFFRSFSLAVPLRSRARWMDRPYVKPLADLLDHYGGYGVALVDKQGARLFHFHLGELREQEGTRGEEVRRTKRGGGSQAPGRRGGTAGQTRYVEELTERNLKEAARVAARFFKDRQVRRVMIGGTDENAALFRQQLPKAWQSLVVGSFPIEATARHSQVWAKAMEGAQRAEHEAERKLVEAVITAAAKGKEGVLGLEGVLNAAHAGQVQTLLISEGFRAPGFRCGGCGYLTGEHAAKCPFCGSDFERIDDAVELAVRKVMTDGGEVEVVLGNRKLDQAGKIAALLRY